MRSLLLGVALGALVPLLASADTPPAKQSTVQQDFEAAQTLSQSEKFAEALVAWDNLERRVRDRPRNLAIVKLRKGQVLFMLDRRDEAVATLNAGLALLPAADPTLRDDRYLANMLLGRVAETSLDYASAAEAYRRADGLGSIPQDHLSALRGVIETETFTDSDAALADLARAQPLLADKCIEDKTRAEFERVESQLKLNRNDIAGARTAAGDGVKLLGGLTAKTDLADVAMRSNYAIAALLLGDREKAREYMAMTGAGRVTNGSMFDPAVQMTPPDCGGDADLRPDDTVIVEFSIGDDGSVVYAAPVYASRRGGVALEFARAVRGWSWTAEQAKALPPFFRYRARVEMRCSTEFAKPSLVDSLDKSLVKWLADRGIETPLKREGSDALLLAAERKDLADLEKTKGADSLALVPVLHVLSRNSVLPSEEVAGFAGRESVILAANKAPAMANLSADLLAWRAQHSDSWGGRAWVRVLDAAATSGPYAADPETRSVLRLLMADSARSFDKPRALALLDQVANDAAVPADNGFKVGALIRKASMYTQRGDAAAAKAAYEQTGVGANQCSLVDTPPRFLGAGGAFPGEAKAWGFEGWVAVQFDIGADGKTVNQRAVISYPPFIFTEAGDATLKSARYEKTFRPGGGLGCGGVTQRVKFVMSNF